MKNLFLISIALLFYFSALSQSVMPEVVATSGDYWIGSNCHLSWTMGETVIETFSSTNNIITQGFQQPTYTITSVEEITYTNYKILVFPNPVSEDLQINFINTYGQMEILNIEILDVTGKTIINDKIENKTGNYTLNMRNYAAGCYFLKITNEQGKLISLYKIQKAN